MNFCIATEGIFPVRGDGGSPVEAYVGEIKMFAGDYAPMGWAFCDGKEMSISENETLYTLLGTTFGGNGQTTFMLPDLRGRLPIGLGQSPGQPNYTLGQRAGAETTTILSTQLPTHTHLTPESAGGKRIKYGNASASGDSGSPLGRHAAIVPGLKQYGKTASTNKTGAFTKGVTALAGATLPHENMQPSLAVSFIICLYGIFPSQF
ncbi:phage tail protein [Sphingobacterium psychroaquaticum]|nr:phage tail protein [Sphingobacterium psychroaquaticum]